MTQLVWRLRTCCYRLSKNVKVDLISYLYICHLEKRKQKLSGKEWNPYILNYYIRKDHSEQHPLKQKHLEKQFKRIFRKFNK